MVLLAIAAAAGIASGVVAGALLALGYGKAVEDCESDDQPPAAHRHHNWRALRDQDADEADQRLRLELQADEDQRAAKRTAKKGTTNEGNQD